MDFLMPEDHKLLQENKAVEFTQLNSFSLDFRIGSGAFRRILSLPVPLEATNSRTRIARKSGWVEYIAPISDPNAMNNRPDGMFPIDLSGETLILQNLHYLDLDKLPILSMSDKPKIAWLKPHVGSMWSAQEQKEREKYLNTGENCKNVRINFKDSFFSLVAGFAGLEKDNPTVFFLKHGIRHR